MSWLKRDVSIVSLLPLLGRGPDGSHSAVSQEQQLLMPSVYLLNEMGYGVKLLVSELSERAACKTIVLHMSRGSKSARMKFVFIYLHYFQISSYFISKLTK